MAQGENHCDGITPPEIPDNQADQFDQAGNTDNADKTDKALSPAYGHGPFTRPLPRPSGCWAGCVRDPCCLTNRPDRRLKTF